MSLVAAAAAGGAFGVRHALETDHLAAIVSLVDGDERSPALTGASWGIGHTVPIAALGLFFLALGVRLPESVTFAVEGVVAVVLVALGVRMLLRATDALGVEVHRHGDPPHRHRHLRLGTLSLGVHLHLDGDSAAVGVLHGVAGSGALVVAMVAAYSSVGGALAFLAAFGVGSTLTMAAVSLAWGRSQGAGFQTGLRVLGGLVGVVVGALLLAEVLGLGFVTVPSLPILH
ncbi:high-affinity nickel-transporter protein [Halobacteriales archaeon Cl-PHB]